MGRVENESAVGMRPHTGRSVRRALGRARDVASSGVDRVAQRALGGGVFTYLLYVSRRASPITWLVPGVEDLRGAHGPLYWNEDRA